MTSLYGRITMKESAVIEHGNRVQEHIIIKLRKCICFADWELVIHYFIVIDWLKIVCVKSGRYILKTFFRMYLRSKKKAILSLKDLRVTYGVFHSNVFGNSNLFLISSVIRYMIRQNDSVNWWISNQLNCKKTCVIPT